MRHGSVQPSVQCRPGMSIAEVVIAATGVSVLAGLGVTIVCLLMTAEQRTMESIVIERTIGDFAHEFRQDAHRASAVTLNDDQTTLSLQLSGDETVTYACTDDAVTRTGATERREEFRLPFGQSSFSLSERDLLITWRHEREPQQEMSLSESPSRLKETPKVYRINAALLAKDVNSGGQP